MLLKKVHNLTLIKNVIQRSFNKKPNGKMFNIVTSTWNPITGCFYDCNYCWARDLAVTKLKNSHRYSKGFRPTINENEFKARFGKNDLIFVSDMGDMFGNFVPNEWINRVLDYVRHFPDTYFLFMTKNPKRYLALVQSMPKNVILGVTIETTKDEIVKVDKLSVAPLPSKRYEAMKTLDWDKKMVSIEPILDFHLDIFTKWIEEINPFIVYIGYDNYGHKLREPRITDTLKLLDKLQETALVIKKTIRPAWFESEQSQLPVGMK